MSLQKQLQECSLILLNCHTFFGVRQFSVSDIMLWCHIESINLAHIPYLSILIDAVVPHIQVTTCYSHLSKITLKLIQMRKQQATESSKVQI